MEKKRRIIPIVSPTSSFAELTKFLSFSFQESEREFVEHVLVTREKALLDELNKTKQERDHAQNKLKEELCKLSKLRDGVQKRERKSENYVEGLGKEKQNEVERREFYVAELKRKSEKYGEELEKERGLCEEKVCLVRKKFELLEEEKRELQKQHEVERREFYVAGLKRKSDKYFEELKRERGFWEEKVCLVRREFERRVELLEEENRELQKENEVEKKKGSMAVLEALVLEKELKRSVMQNGEAMEREREFYEKELERERGFSKELKKEVEDLIESRVEVERKMKEKCDVLEQERGGLEEEVDFLRDKCEELMVESGVVEGMLSLAYEEKRVMEDEIRTQGEMLENQNDVLLGFKEELEKMSESHDQELERIHDLMKRDLSVGVLEKLELEKELKRSMMQTEEAKKELEGYEKQLKRESDLCDKKLSLAAMEKTEFEKKLREEYEERIEVLDAENRDLRKEFEERTEMLQGGNRELRKEFEERIEVLDAENRELRKEYEERIKVLDGENRELRKEYEERTEVLQGENRDLRKEFEERIEVLDGENRELRKGCEERIEVLDGENRELRKEFEERTEVLQGGNRELRKGFEERIEVLQQRNRELRKEYDERIEVLNGENRELRKEFEERTEVLQGGNRELRKELEKKIELLQGGNLEFGKEFEEIIEVLEGGNQELRKKIEVFNESVSSGNADADSGNHSDGRVVSMSDFHDKGSDLVSRPTKSPASSRDPSSKTPQVESRGSEGITIAAHLEEGGGCSKNGINHKRKRPKDETEDDKYSPVVDNKTEGLTESVCKKRSLPMDLIRKVVQFVSKANSPPQVSSTGVKQCKDKNGRNEDSKLHFAKPISSVADGSPCSRGYPDEAESVNKVVEVFNSGKKIGWKHPTDMVSAFENDLELCMAAVCAVYRAGLSGNPDRSAGFSWIDTVSGTTVAKYLINNDQANKLSRSVLEVQQTRPSILRSCQRLAMKYKEQLFEIYQKELDPFF